MPKGLRGFQKGHKINEGKKYLQERCNNISIGNIGLKRSDEAKHNMSISAKKRLENPENHWNWKEGIYIDKDGYKRILMPEHPNCPKSGYILEHRIIVEKFVGRLLKKEEDVHHRDNDRTNNSPFNLMLFINRSAHRRYESGSYVSPDEIIWDGSKLCTEQL